MYMSKENYVTWQCISCGFHALITCQLTPGISCPKYLWHCVILAFWCLILTYRPTKKNWRLRTISYSIYIFFLFFGFVPVSSKIWPISALQRNTIRCWLGLDFLLRLYSPTFNKICLMSKYIPVNSFGHVLLATSVPRGVIFSAYVGSDPAYTVHPPKKSGISSTPKKYLKF